MEQIIESLKRSMRQKVQIENNKQKKKKKNKNSMIRFEDFYFFFSKIENWRLFSDKN